MERSKVQIENMECFIKITVAGVENDQQQDKLFKLMIYNLIIFISLFIIIPRFYHGVLSAEFTLKNELIFLVYLAGAVLSFYHILIAFKVFIWQIAGEEIYEVFPDKLRITKSTFTIGRPREYLKEDITGLEVRKPRTLSTYSITKFNPIEINSTGLIFVNRKGKQPISLGMGLNRYEAVKIVQIMKKQLFSYD